MPTDWDAYVSEYHHTHAGITETAFAHARHPVHGSAHEWLASAVPASAGHVVDLACGTCPVQPHLQYDTYLGIDRSADELAAARGLGRGPVQQGDVADLGIPDASVDTVIMSMALMLVPVDETLSEVARVLRPGGLFAALVPALGPVKLGDLPAIAALAVALRGPGSMPAQLGRRYVVGALRRAGLEPLALSRKRFPFRVANRQDAQLAVSSLYTPGRTAAQLNRAELWLTRLPGRVVLPVPLLRVTAIRSVGI